MKSNKKLEADLIPFVASRSFAERNAVAPWFSTVASHLRLDDYADIEGSKQKLTALVSSWNSDSHNPPRKLWFRSAPKLKFFAAGNDRELGPTQWEFEFEMGRALVCRLTLVDSEKMPDDRFFSRIASIING